MGKDGARLRPPMPGIDSRLFFFFKRQCAESGVRGSGGVLGSELDAVVECVREMEGMDMEGEEGGELEQGDSALGVLGEATGHAAVEEPTSQCESSCRRPGGEGIPMPFAPVGIAERD